MIIITIMIRFVNLCLLWILLLRPLGDLAPLPAAGTAADPTGFTVRYHPDGGLQVGDWVSIQVMAPLGFKTENAKLQVNLVQAEMKPLGESGFAPDGTGRQVAVFLWAWDTHGLNPGRYQLQFVFNGGAQTWLESLDLRPAPAGSQPQWIEHDTTCCRLHAISGTAAARDLDQLAPAIDARAQANASRMGYDLTGNSKNGGSPPTFHKLDIDLIPRVLGQGGFTSDEVIVSYNDHLYIQMDVETVIQHELVHRIDAELGGDLRPTLLAEGLAVYLSGGHYKPEPILGRAVFLPRRGDYLPLPILAENFYDHQHETGYLEAAAFIDFLVRAWGWEAFNRFYRDIHPAPSQREADAIDAALNRHFAVSLVQLDDRFARFLEQQPVLPDLGEDLDVTVSYYDAVRVYQENFDPSANFRQVWLPDPRLMRQRGITADYLRGPQDEQPNQFIEDLLEQAGQAWRAGRFPEARAMLGSVQAALRDASQVYPTPNNVQSLKSSITSSRMMSSRMPMTMNNQAGTLARPSPCSASGFSGICPANGVCSTSNAGGGAGGICGY